MKLRLVWIVFSLFMLSAAKLPDALQGVVTPPGRLDGSVTVQGHVYIWSLEDADGPVTSAQDWANIPGGGYILARRLSTHVEFSGFNSDISTITNDSGFYSVSKGNPWWGNYSVDIEVAASAVLGYDSDDNPYVVDVYPCHSAVYQHNGQTGNYTATRSRTTTVDVYIGGPSNNIADWWGTDWWSRNTCADINSLHIIESFHFTQMILDDYLWLMQHHPTAAELDRDTYILYPSSSDSYNSTLSLPGRGTIDITNKRFFPSKLSDDMSRREAHPFKSVYQETHNTLTHEYAHKIMGDVYWTLPPNWTGEEHGLDKCVNRDLAFLEGWADFLPAAVIDFPSVKGSFLQPDNIEQASIPPGALATFTQGSVTWRDKISCGDQNEGENAAVFWDVYDPQGWEYLPKAQQDAKPAYWPSDLQWWDSVSDPSLEMTWSLLADHNPDCMIDDDDMVWRDSFWHYWLDQYSPVSSDSILIHGMKAILYNRGIQSTRRPERAPANLVISNVNAANATAQIQVSEPDSEDRTYLRYNIAYRLSESDTFQLMYANDRLFDSSSVTWNGERMTTTLALPPQAQWNALAIMVHDNMIPVYATYGFTPPCDTQLTPIGWRQPVASQARSVTVLDQYVLLSIGDGVELLNKEQLLSQANPTQPGAGGYVGTYSTPVNFSAQNAWMDTNSVYASDGVGGLVVMNRASTTLSGSYARRYDGDMRNYITDTFTLQPHNGYLYMSAGYNGLMVMDVSDPTQPREATNYLPQTNMFFEEFLEENVVDLVVNPGGMVFLAASNSALYVASLTPPNWYPVTFNYTPIQGTFPRLALDGNRLYVTQEEQGLTILDVTGADNGTPPTALGALNSLGSTVSVSASGNRAFVGSEHGFYLLDVNDPANPQKMCFIEGLGIQQVYFANNTLYIVSTPSGLRVYRVNP
jgi:hypothetical protein